MNEPGIFRVSGSLVHVKALKQSIDEGIFLIIKKFMLSLLLLL